MYYYVCLCVFICLTGIKTFALQLSLAKYSRHPKVRGFKCKLENYIPNTFKK